MDGPKGYMAVFEADTKSTVEFEKGEVSLWQVNILRNRKNKFSVSLPVQSTSPIH